MSLPSLKRNMYIELITKQLKAENSDPDDEADIDVDSLPRDNNYDEEYD